MLKYSLSPFWYFEKNTEKLKEVLKKGAWKNYSRIGQNILK